jgi:hypothetical protein
MFNNSSYKITNTDKLIIKNSIDKLHQDDRKGLNQLIELFSYQDKLIDFIIYYWNSTKFPNSQF